MFESKCMNLYVKQWNKIVFFEGQKIDIFKYTCMYMYFHAQEYGKMVLTGTPVSLMGSVCQPEIHWLQPEDGPWRNNEKFLTLTMLKKILRQQLFSCFGKTSRENKAIDSSELRMSSCPRQDSSKNWASILHGLAVVNWLLKICKWQRLKGLRLDSLPLTL